MTTRNGMLEDAVGVKRGLNDERWMLGWYVKNALILMD